MAKFDRRPVVNEASTPDVTHGYANFDITRPEEIIEEPQEAAKVRTRSDLIVSVTNNSKNEDIKEDNSLCYLFWLSTPDASLFMFVFKDHFESGNFNFNFNLGPL